MPCPPGYCRRGRLRRQEPAGGRVSESPELSQDTSLGPGPSRTGWGTRHTAPTPAAPHLLAWTQPCSPHILRILGERPASSHGAWNRWQVSVGKAPSPLFKKKRKPTSDPPSLGFLPLWGLLRGRVSGDRGVNCKSQEECSKALHVAPTHIPGGDTRALRGLLPGTPPPGVTSRHGDS